NTASSVAADRLTGQAPRTLAPFFFAPARSMPEDGSHSRLRAWGPGPQNARVWGRVVGCACHRVKRDNRSKPRLRFVESRDDVVEAALALSLRPFHAAPQCGAIRRIGRRG